MASPARPTKSKNDSITEITLSKTAWNVSPSLSTIVPLSAFLIAEPIFPNALTTRPATLVTSRKNGEKTLRSPFPTRIINFKIAKTPPNVSRRLSNVSSLILNSSDISANLLINEVILSAESSPNTSVHASLKTSKIGSSSFRMFLMPCSILSRPEGSLKLAISLSNFSICAAASSIVSRCSSVISLSVSSAFPRSSTASLPFW